MHQDPINLLRDPKEPLPPKKAFITIAVVVFLVIFVFSVWHTFTGNKTAVDDATILKPRHASILTVVKNFIFHSNNVLLGEADDRINILVLGIGGPGHDGPYLSDTNIIASIKPSTKEVALISIPRDLAVKVGNHGVRKINSADAFGELEHPGAGGDYARQIFGETFAIDIPYYVRLDFKAFTEIIDTVGGVDVNVPRTFTDTAYPAPNFAYQTISFTAGQQNMNGETALEFSRSRHGNNGEGSDFARAKRQQLVIEALKAKIFSVSTFTNPIKIQEILSSLSNHVSTNLSFGQLMYLGTLARTVSASPKQLVLDDSPRGFLVQTTGDNGAFLLSPKTGNFDSINAAISGIFDTTSTPSTIATSATSGVVSSSTKTVIAWTTAGIEVQNGTWRAGLAAQVADRLKSTGLPVLSISNSIKRPIDHTIIYRLNNGVDPEVVKAITKQIPNAKITDTLPDWLNPNYDNSTTPANEVGLKYNTAADLLLIIGADYK